MRYFFPLTERGEQGSCHLAGYIPGSNNTQQQRATTHYSIYICDLGVRARLPNTTSKRRSPPYLALIKCEDWPAKKPLHTACCLGREGGKARAQSPRHRCMMCGPPGSRCTRSTYSYIYIYAHQRVTPAMMHCVERFIRLNFQVASQERRAGAAACYLHAVIHPMPWPASCTELGRLLPRKVPPAVAPTSC